MNITLVTIAVGLENNKLFQHIRKFFFKNKTFQIIPLQIKNQQNFFSNQKKKTLF